MSFFDEIFVDGPFGGKELNVNFLRQRGYGVKNVFDGNNFKDFEYFDSIINQDSHNGYAIYAAYHKQEMVKHIHFTLDEALDCLDDYPAASVIFEFIGRDFFIFMVEVDFYQIFGSKEQLKKIDHYDYSDEYAKKLLEKLNKSEGRGYYQWLYDTYQHL